MKKILFLFFNLFFVYGINVTKAQGQNKADAGVFVIINKSSYSTPVNYSNSFSGRTIIIPIENSNLLNSSIQNLGSFSVSSENSNMFSVSLPTQPVIIKNSENGNTLQLTGWQATAISNKNGLKQNIKIVNLEGALKIETVVDNKSGVYEGTYPITFVYN